MTSSPFEFQGPLPPEDVLGRESEIAEVIERVSSGRALTVAAPRR